MRIILLLLALCIATNGYAQKTIPQNQQQIQLSYAPLVKKVAPAVVNIYTKKKVRTRSFLFEDPFFNQFFGRNRGPIRERFERSLGSGVIVKQDGLIITNYHVIKNSDEITVELQDKREYAATIILIDKKTDLAVLRISDQGAPYPTVELVNSDDVEIGDLVLAIGNAFGVGQTVTSGIVSALARTTVGIADFQFFIQTDAAINPGNSGGPLIDMQGRMIGINTAIYSRSGGSNGIGFATPSNMVSLLIDSANKGNKVIRPWLGTTHQAITRDIAASLGLKSPTGVLVSGVYKDSPADKAGIEVGDVIISINNKPVDDNQTLRYRIATQRLNSKISIGIIRNNNPKRTINVTLVAPPEIPTRDTQKLEGTHPLSGATVINLSPAVAEEFGLPMLQQGVLISALSHGYASRFGFMVKDVIKEVNGIPIMSTKQLVKLLRREQNRWQITYKRKNNTHTIRIGR